MQLIHGAYLEVAMESLYFIRIGGTAMGGVAAACKAQGSAVYGSEETLYEPMKSYLAGAGVTVFPSFDPSNISKCNPDQIVVGNAVSRGNEELELALKERRRLISLPQLVSERLIDRNASVVVTGTHGKTTTTAMALWLLELAGLRPGFMVGGVPGNINVSCRPVPSDLHNTDKGIFVIEGDEYDTAFFDKRSKFLWYRPQIAILNNLEFDHADIFPDLEFIKRSFSLFLRQVPANGLVLSNGEDQNLASVLKDYRFSPVETFGLDPSANWCATGVRVDQGLTSFGVSRAGVELGDVTMSAAGEHNVRNMLAAIAQAVHLGVPFAAIQAGVASFCLPKRRMEQLADWRGAIVVDDFAHHPTALRETIKAIRAKYPGKRIFVVFEPRSNSTTRNLFAREFETCFDGAAGVFFGALDRPWRYEESERLDTAGLARLYRDRGLKAEAMTLDQGAEPDWGKYALAALERWVQPGDLVLLGSNGDIGGLRKLLAR